MSSLQRMLIKQGLITKRVHRIRMLQQTITQGADSPFSLLTCDDEPNYDLTTDGSNLAECHPGSKIVAVQLAMTIYNITDGESVEWIIGRDPDGSILTTGFTVATLFTADLTLTGGMLRKNAWGVGHVIGSNQDNTFDTRLNITKALRRSSKMADGDTIRLVFTMSAAASNALFYLRGRIITVGP